MTRHQSQSPEPCGWDGQYCQAEHKDAEITRLEAEVVTWRLAEHNLSRAYLRLRKLIPGAYDTPTAPTGEQVWAITEQALRVALRQKPKRRGEPPSVTPRRVPEPDR